MGTGHEEAQSTSKPFGVTGERCRQWKKGEYGV